VEEPVLPRARLLGCARLAELRIQIEITEDDVVACLGKLPALRSLHLTAYEGGIDPEVISSLGELEELRCLNLSSGLRNYYEYGEQIANENLDALMAMAERLDKLVQLDLSGHHDAFYACVEGDYCPYDTLSTIACKLDHGFRVLNLSENGRKFAWGQLRREMRCLNEDAADEGRVGVTIHYGDGVTEYAAGADGVERMVVGEDEDEDESMEGSDEDNW
jgi:hypothetical protein